ncbi:MAG TPA: aldehyde dehydrogenase family protein, partial [Pirellulales bacterium]
MDDADLDAAATAIAATGYGNAGQVCISTKRVLAVRPIYGDLLDAVKPKVSAIQVGNPLAEDTKMGPMIREADAQRVHDWLDEAVAAGAKIVTGGHREGTHHEATLVSDVKP